MTKEKAVELYKEYLKLDLWIEQLVEYTRNIPKDLGPIKVLQLNLLKKKNAIVSILHERARNYLNLEEWEWEGIR